MKILPAFLSLAALLTAAGAVHSQPKIKLVPFAGGFVHPDGIYHAGDSRLFVLEQPGKIFILDPTGARKPTPYLDITGRVNSNGTEQGLLGLAFHPYYSTNGYFYVNYTGSGDSIHIARFHTSTQNPDSAEASSETRIMTVYHPYGNHNAGDLKFGPDGYLYIGMGDGGSEGDPQNLAQNRTVLLGKILRIDVDNGDPYTIPPTNPFVNQLSVRWEIWSYGLRNPWRFSFDRLTGDLWIADVGGSRYEETDFRPAGDPGGENWGWRCYEGDTLFNPAGCLNVQQYSFPVYVYPHVATNPCTAVTGGYVYRGTLFPNMAGYYLFADYCTDEIRSLNNPGGNWIPSILGQFPGNNFSTYGENSAGELFIAGRTSGNIYHVTDTSLTGISFHHQPAGVNAHPNPCRNILTVELSKRSSSYVNLILYSPEGKILLSQRTNENTADIDLGTFPPGFYYLRADSEAGAVYRKIVKL
jgi:glucose/arabinose dehydrogenase